MTPPNSGPGELGPEEWHVDAIPDEFPPEEIPLDPPRHDPPPSPAPPRLGLFSPPNPNPDPPPMPQQIVEAMLFVGGHPVTAEVACAAVRGLTSDGFRIAIDDLNARYRRPGRPYAILPRDGGYTLALLPAYRGMRERLFGGPREARLNQPALDVLAVIAYRQPVGKAEIDAVRGMDSGGVIRQLVRLGLIAVQHRAEAGAKEVRYGTTPRFLQVFGVTSLDELPRLGETVAV